MKDYLRCIKEELNLSPSTDPVYNYFLFGETSNYWVKVSLFNQQFFGE